MNRAIAIGGVGGSGTRVVAEILRLSDVYIGDWIKHTNDNLAFTTLFRNPDIKGRQNANEVARRINLFKSYMVENRLSVQEALLFCYFIKNNSYYKTKPHDFIQPFKKVFGKSVERKVWAWKEPNTYFFIDELFSQVPHLKYVHVLRHGLDMAFSSNSMQLKNWGYLFDLNFTGTESPPELSYKKLEFWIRSTQFFLQKRENHLGKTFTFSHSSFCDRPRQTIDIFLEFCEVGSLNKDSTKFESLLPTSKSYLGRYKKHDIGVFDKKQIEFVKEMGFEI